MTQKQLFPDIKAALQQEYNNQHNIFPPLADQYIHDYDNNAFAVITGQASLQFEQGLAVSFVTGLLAYLESRHQQRELSRLAAILFRVRAGYGDVVKQKARPRISRIFTDLYSKRSVKIRRSRG